MPTLAAWLHTLDPFAIKFPEGFFIDGIRWYGLAYLAGFLVGYLLIRRVAAVGVSTVKPKEVMDMVVAAAFGVVIGGRLGYVLFYKPALFIEFSSSPPWWGVLAINEGGMASHGGIIGAIIGCMLFAYKRGHRPAFVLDLGAFATPVGLFIGRIANFINGELLGRPAPDGLPWAVKFPQEMEQWSADKLEQARPAIDMLREFGRLPRQPLPTLHDYVPGLIHFLQQGEGEMHRQAVAIIEPLLTARHPSQLYQAFVEGAVLFAVLAIVWWKPRKPLIIGSLFMAIYGALRIVSEFFREPDAHIRDEEFAALGITRGQWLSVLMVVAGVVLMVVFSRRNVERMGSWRRNPV